MKKTNGYTVNVMANTATITKEFAKRANDINSTEYKTICQLRKDGYSIVYKTVNIKANKEKHKGLTIEFMNNYINCNDNYDTIIGEYTKEKNIWKGHPAYYAKIKQWFLNQFPELTASGIKKETESKEATTALLNEHEATKKGVNELTIKNENEEFKIDYVA